MSDMLVEFESVSVCYKETLGIDRITFGLTSGTTLGLLGPNGAGKSTCLKAMAGLIRPTSGHVRILNDENFGVRPHVRQQIGYVPEDPWLYPWMTARQIVRFAAPMYERWDNELAEELISDFDLPADRPIRTLSKGTRVKAALLVALAHRPRLLVMDEPLAGLDPLARDDMVSQIVRAKSEGTECVVISSHQIDEIVRLADQVAILNRSRMVVHADLNELQNSAKRIEAVLVDGCLPKHELRQTVWRHINRREWSMTVYPFNESLVDELQRNNSLTSISVSDLGIEQIMKDVIRGDQQSCSVL